MAPRGWSFCTAVRNGSDSSPRWHYMPSARDGDVLMPTRNVVLTNHQAALVERLVESGRYQNASEVLREGLRLIERREAEDEAKLRGLREAVQVGIDDMEAGRYTTLETPEQIDEHVSRLTNRVLRRRGTGH